jgi:hypothetical protein
MFPDYQVSFLKNCDSILIKVDTVTIILVMLWTIHMFSFIPMTTLQTYPFYGKKKVQHKVSLAQTIPPS